MSHQRVYLSLVDWSRLNASVYYLIKTYAETPCPMYSREYGQRVARYVG